MPSVDDILTATARRFGLLALAAVPLLIAFGNDAQAGVILPWEMTPNSIAADSAGFGCSASASVARDSAIDPRPEDVETDSITEKWVVDFSGAAGGTAPPGDSASGATNLVVADVSPRSPFVRPPERSPRQIRERMLHLPQPPTGELLDPPKR